ncbi:MAG TPA: arginine--tRNA ligase [Syntrophales bacterium]|mgnify:CR=1 FL=1|nr:arginine--tRNA ligase [Syntrophales bacterium]HPQ43422.1 arginine--tRNA ligase [Syntrophales bacterium]
MKKKLTRLLEESINSCIKKELLKKTDIPPIEVELPKEGSHGDYASNIAMVLASSQREAPRKIAERIVKNINDSDRILDKIEIAGPGFINFFIRSGIWSTLLEEVDTLGDNYGHSDIGDGIRVQVEFVSANPTGPLHIGHARGAVIGDTVANILQASGYSVSREYYINDAGNQMNRLGESVYFRYLELMGDDIVFPEDCYQGEYITELAREIYIKFGDKFRADKESSIGFLTKYAADSILEGIKEDLEALGITFDRYFSESELYVNDGVAKIIRKLREEGFIYEAEGTLWFKTTDSGDEKDRVVVRGNGDPTYFAADIAYHQNKYARGFDKIINVWGADHHGYIPRMQAGIQALGRKKEDLEVILVQLVNLLRGGVPVPMSTRSGEFVTTREVTEEVGKDAARYNFLMRRSNSHLDFDLELAKAQSSENPVYYVQYAHARISSIMRLAEEQGYRIPVYNDIRPELLVAPEEHDLAKMIDAFPEMVEGSVKTLEPHRIPYYINDLASIFHSFYNKHKVVSDDIEMTKARLFLIKTTAIVIRNALRLLGVSAPERM